MCRPWDFARCDPEGREWRPPHYEKLLDVNASLALVFSETYRVTQNLRYKEAAEATVTYLRRTLYGFVQGDLDPHAHSAPDRVCGPNDAALRARIMPEVDAIAREDPIYAAGVESAPAFKRLRGQLAGVLPSAAA